MTIRTYVKVGFAGYGPDLDPEDTGIETDDIRGVCNAIRYELDSIADSENDVAEMYAEQGDFEDAWLTHKLGDAMGILAMNLDYDRRAKAPMYANDHGDLDVTMERIIGENFPLDIEIHGSRRLYVWEGDDEQ